LEFDTDSQQTIFRRLAQIAAARVVMRQLGDVVVEAVGIDRLG
jgi:hypothetical protein